MCTDDDDKFLVIKDDELKNSCQEPSRIPKALLIWSCHAWCTSLTGIICILSLVAFLKCCLKWSPFLPLWNAVWNPFKSPPKTSAKNSPTSNSINKIRISCGDQHATLILFFFLFLLSSFYTFWIFLEYTSYSFSKYFKFHFFFTLSFFFKYLWTLYI